MSKLRDAIERARSDEGRAETARGQQIAAYIIGGVVILGAVWGFWPQGLPDCTDMGETVRDLLKDDYRAELRLVYPEETVNLFLDQPFVLKAVRRMPDESNETTNVCECELHGRKLDAAGTSLLNQTEWLQSVAYEVYLTEDDEVWVQLLE